MKCIESLQRVVLSTVLIALVTPVVAQDKIPWITDLRQARETAERQHRLVLLHFWSDDCVPCKQVERNVFNQPEFIRAVTTGYIPVKINANQQPQLADFYKIERVPTDVIVTPEGREVHRFQSLQDSNQYIAMLDGIRAQASIGAHSPVSPSQLPVSTPARQETASASPYTSAATAHSDQSRYVQGGYNQSPTAAPSAADATPANTATPAYTQNRYTNPLDQPAAPQQRELAPRYANPYAQQDAGNANTSGSRWGQPTQAYGSNGANQGQQPAASAVNEYVGPTAAQDWRQNVAAGQPPATQHQGLQNQGLQNQGMQNQGMQHQGMQHQGPQGQPPQHASTGGSAMPPRFDASSQAQPPTAQPQPNAGQPQISLEGYCPVTLVHNRVWTPGDKKWGAVHEGRVYLFAGPEQQKQFLSNPMIYAPLMAGYDPVRFAETRQLVPGRREFGLYIDEPGPIALFADEASLERFHANSNYYFGVIRQAKTQQAGGATR